jgi:hypothetical protein
MQALCYTCRKWFHTTCLEVVGKGKAREIRLKKWDCQVMPRLLNFAMAVMRRGNPHGVEGDYGNVYQAQSILIAHMNGNSKRLKLWMERHGHEREEVTLDCESILYMCPECGYII